MLRDNCEFWVLIDRVDPRIVIFAIDYVNGYPDFVVIKEIIVLSLCYLIEIKLATESM